MSYSFILQLCLMANTNITAKNDRNLVKMAAATLLIKIKSNPNNNSKTVVLI